MMNRMRELSFETIATIQRESTSDEDYSKNVAEFISYFVALQNADTSIVMVLQHIVKKLQDRIIERAF